MMAHTTDSVTAVTKSAAYVPIADLGVLKLTRLSGLMEPPITIYVGADRTVFYAWRSLLRGRVPFFNGALNKKSNFLESQRNEVVLEDEDVPGFRILMEWVLTQKVPQIPLCPNLPKNATFAEMRDCNVVEWTQPWFSALQMADKFQADQLFLDLFSEINFFHERSVVFYHPHLLSIMAHFARPDSKVEKNIDTHFALVRERDAMEFTWFRDEMTRLAPEYVEDWDAREKAKIAAEQAALDEKRRRHNESSRLSHQRRRERMGIVPRAARAGRGPGIVVEPRRGNMSAEERRLRHNESSKLSHRRRRQRIREAEAQNNP